MYRYPVGADACHVLLGINVIITLVLPALTISLAEHLCCTETQSFGSQEWDTAFALQALLASDLTEEIEETLRKGHDFVKKSQVSIFNKILALLTVYLHSAVKTLNLVIHVTLDLL